VAAPIGSLEGQDPQFTNVWIFDEGSQERLSSAPLRCRSALKATPLGTSWL
jgi:hypothetical protein